MHNIHRGQAAMQTLTWHISLMEFLALRESLRAALGLGCCCFWISVVDVSGREFAWTDRSGSRFRKDIRREPREDEEGILRKRSGTSGELSAPSDSSRTVCARQTPTTALPNPSMIFFCFVCGYWLVGLILKKKKRETIPIIFIYFHDMQETNSNHLQSMNASTNSMYLNQISLIVRKGLIRQSRFSQSWFGWLNNSDTFFTPRIFSRNPN